MGTSRAAHSTGGHSRRAGMGGHMGARSCGRQHTWLRTPLAQMRLGRIFFRRGRTRCECSGEAGVEAFCFIDRLGLSHIGLSWPGGWLLGLATASLLFFLTAESELIAVLGSAMVDQYGIRIALVQCAAWRVSW